MEVLKQQYFFSLIAILCFLASCGGVGSSHNNCEGCARRSPSAPLSEADITTPPAGANTQYAGTYDFTKYLINSKYQVHIFGTSGVHDWTMVKINELVTRIIDSIKNEPSRMIFKDHEVLVITDDDPEVPFAYPGMRNGGGHKVTIMNQELICQTAVDTINPTGAPAYREWDTPVHEFGHSVELQLDIRNQTVEFHRQNDPNYVSVSDGEYFASATQSWFSSDYTYHRTRDSIAAFERAYMGTIYAEEVVWVPSCSGRPSD